VSTGRSQQARETPPEPELTSVPLDEERFDAALDTWRREHDLARRRVEHADTQASTLMAVAVTAVVAAAALIGPTVDRLSGVAIAGALIGLLSVGMAAGIAQLVRIRFHRGPTVGRRLKRRGLEPSSEVLDRLAGDEVVDDFDWDSPDWRDALVRLERQRALFRGAVAEGKEKWLAIALALFLGGGVFVAAGAWAALGVT
jgi:hypothetical protein